MTVETRQRVNAMGAISTKIGVERQVSGKTVAADSALDELYQQGSARIRIPRTGPGPLHAVLLNTAGGLTGNDLIEWQAHSAEHSHLCISTAACEKIYRTHGPAATQKTSLHVANHSRLEWLPQESIVFNGSHFNRSLNVHLEEHASVLIAESLVLGRRAMQEDIDAIRVRDRWRIYRNEQLLHAEDLNLNMNHKNIAHSPCTLHQFGAISTLVFITNQSVEWFESLLSNVRSLIPTDSTYMRIGASALPSRLVIRVLAQDSFQLRKFLIPCIEHLNDNRPVPTVWKV